jgi:Ca2+-binding EF-hand superfamily protein
MDFHKGLKKNEFAKLMKINGITSDMGLINKLFWVFDEDGDQHLQFKEIAFGIEMFRESPIETKLKAFFDLCDVDNSGSISKVEFMNLLRKNIINNDEKLSMKQVVDRIFSCVKLDKNGEITFEKLKEGCEKNKEIHDIIYKNLLALKSIDTVIDKDIKKDIMRFNPELNEQLRNKLLSHKTSFIPLRDEKFVKLIEEFISNRVKILNCINFPRKN